MTPHTLRRTFASILAACDVPPRRAMYLMGHTDPTLTLAVYQQVLDMSRGATQRLEEILGCGLAEARAIYNGETVAAGVSVLNPCSSTKNPSAPSGRSAAEGLRIAPICREYSEAAEGTRTLDLLHGKRSALQSRMQFLPGNRTIPARETVSKTASIRAESRGFS